MGKRKAKPIRKKDLEGTPFHGGFTESAEEEDVVVEEWKKNKPPDGITMGLVVNEGIAVMQEHETDLIVEFADGRKFNEVMKVYSEEEFDRMAQGYRCLKCWEPQEVAFGDDHLPGCEGVALRGEHYMRDWQLVDMANEMEGMIHLGPSRPISAFLEDQAQRMEKRRFIKECIDSGRQVPKDLLEDKEIFPNGPPRELVK